ncbi:uncharacterized protein LOC108872644 [Lates calcarifer]|uniref:Uncharacterized protein LOC108872644 n=1 Tax=Lates calcarifer TaxID=8187 RepID=A0AAJ8B189_LATCA|nr:uncharacterized protein LOC108872644 [Lates calcarifer]
MFFLCLSLLSAAAFLQSSVSADEVVSLNCSEAVEVAAGGTVTLTCSIHYQDVEGCKVLHSAWHNTSSIIPCGSGSGEYICDSDHQTYVSLIISNVMKEENYTAAVITDCGMALSFPINVQVTSYSNSSSSHVDNEALSDTVTPGPEKVTSVATISSICVAVIVAAILFFLLGTDKGRNLIKHFMKEKIQRDDSDTVSESSKRFELDF